MQLRAKKEVWVQVIWAQDHTEIGVMLIKPYTDPTREHVRLMHMMPGDSIVLTNIGTDDTPYQTILKSYPQCFVLEAETTND